MSKPRKQQLREDFEAKTREAQTILDKADPSKDEIQRAKVLMNEEIPALKADIEDLNSFDGLKSDLDGFKSWNNDASGVVHPTGNARVTGMKRSGTTVIEREGDESVLYQDGEGLLSDAQIKTIQDPEYADAVKSYIRNKGDMSRLGRDAVKTLSEGIDEDGGVLAPAEMLQRMLERKPTPTRVAGLVTQLTTSRDAVILPRNTYNADDVYTSGVRVTWTGEGGNPAKAQGPQFGTFRVSIYTAMLELGLTNNLLEDAAFPIQSYCAGKFRETVDILRDDMAVNGNGVNQPFGMQARVGAGATAGNSAIDFVKSGDANTVTADGLMDMAYTIPEQYMENSRWLFNRTNTERTIAKLKDADGRYLFASGRESDVLATARPDALLGFGLTRSGLMPNIAANKYPIFFGDMAAYYQILRIGFTLRVLTEIEARSNQTILLGRLRMGGDVGEGWKMRGLKIAA
jgi:HK97 family phage major capsid protein